jgi:hypothetical protein
MWKAKVNYNVDRLKICYKQPQELWDYLSTFNKEDKILYDSFSLLITDNGKSEGSEKESVKIKANVIADDGGLLGEFVFNNSAKYEGKCFFEFENKALYTPLSYYMGEKYNYVCCIDYVASILNLEINNITLIEISADINHNPLPRINKLLTHHEDYDFIYNGKVVEDYTKILEGVGEFYGRSRVKKNRYPTLYLSQKKDDAPSIKIYDKRAEIEDNSKQYISEWNNNLNGTMYRIEVSVKNEDIKKFLSLVQEYKEDYGTLELFLTHLGSQEYKHLLWQWICDRIAYFRAKSGDREVITLHELATKS